MILRGSILIIIPISATAARRMARGSFFKRAAVGMAGKRAEEPKTLAFFAAICYYAG